MTGGHDVVNPASLPRPSGFNHAVMSTDGRTVWLAGQTALDADGRVVAPGNVVGQFEQALSNLLTVLGAAGGHPEHLVSMTVYCVDIEDYRTHAHGIGDVWRRLVGTHYPAMAAVGVSRLWDIEALVEVQGVAVLPPAREKRSGPPTSG
ncbi:MAG TPA: RidA family protein [Jiangellaceae bacterium]|jgi:enamine deaminase RidA (YjgF/YER057c/UK114 family)|nr:RidA family protein [Jiangellaceae bacterium]